MIEKLKSRAPLDVADPPKRGMSIVGAVFAFGGLLTLGLLGLAALDALGLVSGAFSVRNFVLMGLGIGGFVAAWAALAMLASRSAKY